MNQTPGVPSQTLLDPRDTVFGCGVQGDTYLGTTFELHYPSVDDLVNTLH